MSVQKEKNLAFKFSSPVKTYLAQEFQPWSSGPMYIRMGNELLRLSDSI